jgi:hypothetical protein
MLINGAADFVVKDHHRDAWHWREHKDYVRIMVGLPDWQPRGHDPEAIKRKQARQNTKRRIERARRRKIPLRLSRPWLAAGISRATWYRRGGRRAVVRQVSPTDTKFPKRKPRNDQRAIEKTRIRITDDIERDIERDIAAAHTAKHTGTMSLRS